MQSKKHIICNVIRPLITGVLFCIFYTSVYAQIQFEDKTSAAGGFHVGESWGASWGDFNGDLLSDLFVSNHRDRPSIYRNNGDGTFTDVTLTADRSRTWLNLPLADTHGGSWLDIDADGDQDLMIATGSQIPPQLFINNDGIFTDQTTALGIPDDGGGRMSAGLDYDNDGRLDIALMNSGSSKLLRQKSDGTFVKTNTTAGFDCNGFRSNYAQFSDIDNDIQTGGALEFFCMRDGTSPAKVYDTSAIPFIDVSSSVPTAANVVDTVMEDFDGNLYPDIFMVRGALRPSQALEVEPQKIESFINVGNNSTQKDIVFTTSGLLTADVNTLDFGVAKVFIGVNGIHPSAMTFNLDPADSDTWGIMPHEAATDEGLFLGYDTALQEWRFQLASGGDSVVAYFTINSTQSIADLSIDGLDVSDAPINPRLLLNMAGVFQNQTGPSGLNSQISCVHAAAGDFDNDMDVDLYVVCRGGVENLANKLFENQGDGTFVEITGAGGAQGPVGVGLDSGVGTGEAVVISDYDLDGFLDLLVLNGLNLQPIHVGGPDKLYRNVGNSNHWIQLDLVGTASNIEAIGAKVHATAGGVTQMREQNGSYHRWSQDDQRIHFGLGANSTVDLTVYWPNGDIDIFSDVSADQLYKVVQGPTSNTNGTIETAQPLPIHDFPFPGAGDECGDPIYDPKLDKVFLIWKNCTTNTWHVRSMSGGSESNIEYNGTITADQVFSSVSPNQFESSDILDFATNPKVISFRMKMKGNGQDGFDFSFPAGSSVCLRFSNLPAGAQVLIGSKHLPVILPFDLISLGSCKSENGIKSIISVFPLLLLD